MERTQEYLDLFNDAATVLLVTTDPSVWEPFVTDDPDPNYPGYRFEYTDLRHLQGKAEGILAGLRVRS